MQMRRKILNIYSPKEYFYNPFSVSKTLDIYPWSCSSHEVRREISLSSLDGLHLKCRHLRALNSINSLVCLSSKGRKTEERERTVEGYVRLNSAVEYDFIENTEKYPQMENPQAVLEYVDMFF